MTSKNQKSTIEPITLDARGPSPTTYLEAAARLFQRLHHLPQTVALANKESDKTFTYHFLGWKSDSNQLLPLVKGLKPLIKLFTSLSANRQLPVASKEISFFFFCLTPLLPLEHHGIYGICEGCGQPYSVVAHPIRSPADPLVEHYDFCFISPHYLPDSTRTCYGRIEVIKDLFYLA